MRTETNPKLVDALTRHVDCLAGLIGPRHLGQPKALAAAATYVERELAGAGYEVTRQTYLASGQEVANLVAELPGGRRAKETIVVGAHYDTVWCTPGADDNASAVAVLIEAARLMRGLQPKRTVRIIGFPCEEPPHFHTGEMGSQVYARECRVRGEDIRGLLCFVIVGYFTTEPGKKQIPPGIPRVFHPLLPKRGDFLAAVGNLRSWRLVWQFRRGFKRAVRFPLLSLALPESIQEIRLSDNS